MSIIERNINLPYLHLMSKFQTIITRNYNKPNQTAPYNTLQWSIDCHEVCSIFLSLILIFDNNKSIKIEMAADTCVGRIRLELTPTFLIFPENQLHLPNISNSFEFCPLFLNTIKIRINFLISSSFSFIHFDRFILMEFGDFSLLFITAWDQSRYPHCCWFRFQNSIFCCCWFWWMVDLWVVDLLWCVYAYLHSSAFMHTSVSHSLNWHELASWLSFTLGRSFSFCRNSTSLNVIFEWQQSQIFIASIFLSLGWRRDYGTSTVSYKRRACIINTKMSLMS